MNCLLCNKSFSQSQKEQRYCSIVCRQRARYRRRYAKLRDRFLDATVGKNREKKCVGCDAYFPIKGSKKFCSNDCREKSKVKPRVVVTKNCLQCGTEFKTHKSIKKFCNLKCTIRFNTNRHPNGLKTKKRRQAIKRCSNCENCGINNIHVLEIHHIKTLEVSHKKENLMTLCCNCHTFYHRLVGHGFKSENQSKEFVLDTLKSGLPVVIK